MSSVLIVNTIDDYNKFDSNNITNITKLIWNINYPIENIDLKNLKELQFKKININVNKKLIKFNNYELDLIKYDFEYIFYIIKKYFYKINK